MEKKDDQRHKNTLCRPGGIYGSPPTYFWEVHKPYFQSRGWGGQIMCIIWALGFFQFFHQEYETLKKLCEFSTVWADRSIFGSTENVCNFAKYFYFYGFFHVFMGKKVEYYGRVMFYFVQLPIVLSCPSTLWSS